MQCLRFLTGLPPKLSHPKWCLPVLEFPYRCISTSKPMRNHHQYDDLLVSLRDVGDIRWCLKPHGLTRNIAEADYQKIKSDVLNSERLRHTIAELAGKETSSKSVDQLYDDSRAILEEMSHRYDLKYVRLMGLPIVKALQAMYEHVWVNTEALENVRSLFFKPDIPVVLMPTHRSYVDFLLVSTVFFHYGLPLPTIAAGIDFMAMKGVGEILRRCGAFFIRRSFADDPLYRTIFTEYVANIIEKGDQPLEFFVEGTRSRSGKSLYPKFGMMSSVMESYFRGSVTDVLLVPITISYERMLEEALYARELLGIPKPKESTSGLLKARSVFKDNYGSIWFHVGKPISVREFVGNRVDRSSHNLAPHHLFSTSAKELSLAKDLALLIVQEQRKGVFIHPWSILSTVLLQQTQNSNTVYRIHEILAECNKLINLINLCDPTANLAHLTRPGLTECLRLHSRILFQSPESPDFLEFSSNALKDPKSLHVTLGNYRNQLIHTIAPTALHLLISRNANKDFDAADFIYRVFSREFVLPSDGFRKELIVADDFLLEIIEPFLVSYSLCLHILQSDIFSHNTPFRSMKEATLAVQKSMTKLTDYGVYSGFEVLSSDTIVNCLSSLKAMGALKSQSGLNRDVLRAVCFKLDGFLPSDLALRIAESVDAVYNRSQAVAKI